MIPELYINEWHEEVPWSTPQMVEQDLIICRALISIFFLETILHSEAGQHYISSFLVLNRDIVRISTLCKFIRARLSLSCFVLAKF